MSKLTRILKETITKKMKTQLETMIAGYCASSTECSDHNLQKVQKFKLVLFFSYLSDKKNLIKNRN